MGLLHAWARKSLARGRPGVMPCAMPATNGRTKVTNSPCDGASDAQLH